MVKTIIVGKSFITLCGGRSVVAPHPNMCSLLNVYLPYKSGIAAHVALGEAWHLGMSDLTNCQSLALAMECTKTLVHLLLVHHLSAYVYRKHTQARLL